MLASVLQLPPSSASKLPKLLQHPLRQITEQPPHHKIPGDEMSESPVESASAGVEGGQLEMPVLTRAEFEALRKYIIVLSKVHVQEAMAEMDAARREEIQDFRNKLEQIQFAVNENAKMMASFLSALNDPDRHRTAASLHALESQQSFMAAPPKMHGDVYGPHTPPYGANDIVHSYGSSLNRYNSPSTSRETPELPEYPSSFTASSPAIDCSPTGIRDYTQAIQALRDHAPHQPDLYDLPDSSPTTLKPISRRPMGPSAIKKRPVTPDNEPEFKRRRVFPTSRANPLHPPSFAPLSNRPYPKPNEYKLFPGAVTYVMQKEDLVVVSFPDNVPQGLEATVKRVIGELEARRPGWRSAPGLFNAMPCIFNYGHGGGSTWTCEGRYRYACRSCSSQGRPCIKMSKNKQSEDLIEVTVFSLHPTLRKQFSRAHLDFWVHDAEYVFDYDCFKNALK
ncbi:hypothetical protein BU16DRAFT_379354 [Lophium mytilinum]|uniref:Uncharacterized protein n=1 Tax=Lophium mytilinum TaxID=390894 RepID=A0A6A6QRG1_9PEZI|nr:hypothetical protein BU16DRAFT_379354 [Lophium mytilinum]